MTSALGFLGLILNLASMTMKSILYLRLLSLIANTIYFIYGLLIAETPIIVGSLIAVIIHAVSIYNLNRTQQITLTNSNRKRTI
jgi:hypothetical protein